VGVTEFSAKPDSLNSARNSDSVRSSPPGNTIIVMSKSLELDRSFPVGATQSTTSSFACFGIARRSSIGRDVDGKLPGVVDYTGDNA
jgi:hypothetical protein